MFSGIAYAIGAMLGWGVGDFAIERSTLRVGAIPSLFYISVFSTIVLFPLAWPYLGIIFSHSHYFWLLALAGVATFVGSTLQFIAFEKGKLSVIEPILGLELPITIGFAIAFGNEIFTWLQAFLTFIFFVGLILVVTKHHLQLHYHKRMFESGVVLSLVAALLYGLQNFTIGSGSQQISPWATLWFIHTLTAVGCLVFLVFFPKRHMAISLKQHWPIVTLMVFLDSAAWVAYSLAVTKIPISLAITIGESYIILTVLLGLILNRDKVKFHQIIGMAIACFAVIVLSSLHPG